MALLFRFRATLGLLLLACLLTACQGVWGVNLRPTATPIGANLTTQGYEAYQAGDYAVALRTFTAAISANANDSGAYYGRGVTAYQLGDLQNAYSDFSQAMNLGFTPIAWVYESRGLVAFEQQQLEQALSDLRQAAKLDPQKAEIFWNLGRVLFATHNDLEALVQFNKAITLNPNVAAFYRARGETYADIGDSSLALADYSQAIVLDSSQADLYLLRGTLYNELKNYPAAVADLQQATQLDSTLAVAYYRLGQAYQAQQVNELAWEQLNRAAQLNLVADAAFYSLRGQVAFALNLPDQALQDLNQALALDSNKVQDYQLRGQILMQKGQLTEAAADFQQAILRAPDNLSLYSLRAQTYLQANQTDLAIADIERVLRSAPNNAEALYLHGLAYQTRNPNQALSDWSGAIAAQPDYAVAYYQRALLYQTLQDWDNTLKDFQAALDHNFEPALQIYQQRSAVYLRLEQFTNAVADYTRVINADQQNAFAYLGRAQAYARNAEMTAAAADLVNFRSLYRGDPMQIAKTLGNTYFLVRDYTQALEQFNIALQGESNDPALLLQRVQTQTALDNYTAVLGDLETLISRQPNNPLYYGLRGNAYFKLNQLDNALKDFDRAAELNYQPLAWLFNSRGTVYTAKQDYTTALADFTLSINADDQYAIAYYNRALVQQALGNPTEAVTDLQNYLTLEKDPGLQAKATARLQQLTAATTPAP